VAHDDESHARQPDAPACSHDRLTRSTRSPGTCPDCGASAADVLSDWAQRDALQKPFRFSEEQRAKLRAILGSFFESVLPKIEFEVQNYRLTAVEGKPIPYPGARIVDRELLRLERALTALSDVAKRLSRWGRGSAGVGAGLGQFHSARSSLGGRRASKATAGLKETPLGEGPGADSRLEPLHP
jgi:hypothetical protein